MNRKHMASLIVALLAAAAVYGTLWTKDRLTAMKKAESSARAKSEKASADYTRELSELSTLRNRSDSLIRFLDAWEPYFEGMNTPQTAELGVSLRIKEDGLITLAQRYEPVGLRGEVTIPRVMRANLTIEDDYVRTLNWLGKIEQQIPTLRISNLRLTKGQRANDIKQEIVLDVPLARAAKATK